MKLTHYTKGWVEGRRKSIIVGELQLESINKHFDRCLEFLNSYHEVTLNLPGGVTLDLGAVLKVIHSKEEMTEYAVALWGLLVIGLRNGWIHSHVDGKGRPVYMYIKKDVFKGW